MNKQVIGPWGFFTHSGRLIGLFTVSGGFFTFGESVAKNLREKNDALNQFYGGVLGGMAMGAFRGTVPFILGGGFFVGSILGVTSWAGHSLNGLGKDSLKINASPVFIYIPQKQDPYITYYYLELYYNTILTPHLSIRRRFLSFSNSHSPHAILP